MTPQQQDDLAAENLTLAAKAVAAIRGTILVRPSVALSLIRYGRPATSPRCSIG